MSSDLITVQLPRQAAQSVLMLVQRQAKGYPSGSPRRRLDVAATALAAALKQPVVPCDTCHGTHLVRNGAWDEFWRQIEAELPGLDDPHDRRLDGHKAAFTASHGPELIACPTCSGTEVRRG